MVALDTDVLILAFAFHRDERQADNRRFLTAIQDQAPVVAIYTVMEVLGKLSFNLSAQRLTQWTSWLQDRYRLSILYPQTEDLEATTFFQQEFVDQPFRKMEQYGMPFLDGLILNLVELAEVEALVTWNARHFATKTSLTVLTPAEFLTQFESRG